MSVCRSFWDISSVRSDLAYDGSYPVNRRHFDAFIGGLKVRTLGGWLKRLRIDLSGDAVCEVGFGGGHTLRYLSDTAAYACGIDVITECLTHAQALGVSADRLFDGANLPPELPQRIDFWLFQDNFEHIPQPAQFVEWVERNSSANTEVLVVLPEAASISAARQEAQGGRFRDEARYPRRPQLQSFV